MSRAITAYTSYVKSTLVNAEALITKFCGEMAKDPVRALEWGDAIFKVTARLDVLRQVSFALDEMAKPNSTITLETIHESLMDRFMHTTRYLDNRSSGASRNQLNDSRVSVLSEEIKNLSRYLKGEV